MTNPVQVKITGLEEVKGRLKALGPQISKKALDQSVRAGVRPILAEAKRTVPVDTGTLRKSLYSKRIKELSSPEESTFFIGARSGKKWRKKNADGFYFHMVEFGTEKMAARPFMRPAFESKKMSAMEKMKDALLKAVEKFGNYTIG